MKSLCRRLAGAVAAAALVMACVAAAGAEDAPGRFTLSQAMQQAEDYSRQLKLAKLQVPKAKTGLDRIDAATAGPGLEQLLQQRYGVPLPADETTGAALRKSGELTLEQAALGLDAARQSVRMAVTKAYLDWQKAVALEGAARQALARAEAQAANARINQGAGTASKYDLLQADAQVAAQKAFLLDARNARAIARLTLQRHTGTEIGEGVDPQPSEPDSADPPAAPDVLAEAAYAQRADVAVARLTVTQKEADLELLSQYLPADDPTVAAARLAVEEAALQLEALRADIELQINQATLTIASARERIKSLQGGADQAREAMRLAQLRYEAGAATSLEVLSAQTALAQAETALIQAAADLAYAQAALQQALGAL